MVKVIGILGDIGSGKTFIAKQIHNESNRKTKNFRIVDCKSKNKQFEISKYFQIAYDIFNFRFHKE